MLNSDIKKHLDSERANLLVIGHPGTGKTYNLLSSIEYLVEKKGILPSRILVFCFNRRWSKIIREESARRLNSSFAELPVETFFSFSRDILSYSRISKREKPFTIDVLDSTQQWEILTDIIAGLDERDYPVSKRITLRGKHALAGFTQEVFDFILRAQENLIEPKTLSNKFTPYFDKTLSEITGIYSRYLKRLRSINKYNYGRILTGASRVLQEDKATRDYFQDSYDFIMVDELHEVNTAQLSILNSLAKDNVLMFGNDDESIFSFRGSMIDNLKKIYDSLDRDKIIFLDKDHRSHSAISMLRNTFIKKNSARLEKPDISIKKTDGEHEIVVREIEQGLEGLGFISSRIRELVNHKNIALQDICIIVKGTGYQSRLIEEMLKQEGIPYLRRGTRNILDDNSVNYLIDLARLIYQESLTISDNTERPGKDSLIERVLLLGPGKTDPILLKDLKTTNGLFQSLKSKIKYDKGNDYKRISYVFSLIEEFSPKIDEPVYSFMTGLFEKDMMFKAKDKKEFLKNFDISENLSDFFENLKSYTIENPGKNDVGSYLSFIDNLSTRQFLQETEQASASATSEGKLNILSFHQCKGLEFKAAFIPFMEKGYIPAKFDYPQTYDMRLFRYFVEEKVLGRAELEKRHLEEERKLFYNGISRAKRFLYVTCEKGKEKSMFYEELKTIAEDRLGFDINRKTQANIDDKRVTPWSLRKKASVCSYRILNGKPVDPDPFINLLYTLANTYHPLKWFTNMEWTLNKGDLLGMIDFSFSYSSFDTYRQCPAKFMYRHILDLAEEEEFYLILGRAYHEVIADFIKAGKHDLDGLKTIIEKVFDKIDFRPAYIGKEHKELALENLTEYYEKWMPENPADSIVEKKFSFLLDGFKVRGRIDQINLIKNNMADIVDFKTGSSKFTQKELQEEMQLKIYDYAVRHLDEFKKIKNRDTRLLYHYLMNKKDPIQEVKSTKGDDTELINTLKTIISLVNKGAFDPDRNNKYQCSRCKYQKLCII